MNIQGKISLVTGGSSGIGLALSKKLAALGSHVWILARDPNRLEIARQEISTARQSTDQQVIAIPADVASYDQVCEALEPLMKKYGAPDIMINSAGVTYPGKFTEIELPVFRSMMEVNYFGSLHVIKTVLPQMTQRGSGHIVNISSIAGFLGLYGYSAYGPSKFAIRGLSDSLRYELAEQGIRLSVVFPPDTQTPQLEFETDLKPPVLVELDKNNKVLSADTVAESILKGISRKKYIITPGFDSTLYFHLTNFFGLVYPVMDFMIFQARKVLHRAGGDGAAKNGGSH